MPKEVVDSSMENAVLEYRVDQLEKTQEKMVKTVENVATNVVENNKEQALQKQRLYLLVITMVFVLNTVVDVGKSYLFRDEYNEDEKKTYYETRVSESDKVRLLEKRLKELEDER